MYLNQNKNFNLSYKNYVTFNTNQLLFGVYFSFIY